MSELSKYDNAARMLRVVRAVVIDQVNKMRPQSRIATVVTINRFGGTCDVQLPEDDMPTTVKMFPGCQPNSAGDKVRIVKNSDEWSIDEVVGFSPLFTSGQRIHRDVGVGGDFGNVTVRQMIDAQVSLLPAVGNVMTVGTWNTTDPFSNISGVLEIDLQVRLFNPVSKRYVIPIRYNATNGAWVKVYPEKTGGNYLGDMWALEIMVDTNGFSLRVRRGNASSNTFGSSAPSLLGYFYGSPVALVDGSVLGETSEDPITKSYLCAANDPTNIGTYDYGAQIGPFEPPSSAFPWRAATQLTGGGVITYDGTYLKWSQRFIVIGIGAGGPTPGSYINIPMPPAGSLIPVVNNSSVGSVAVTASGIPMAPAAGWRALYYELPIGSGSFPTTGDLGDPTNFRIIDYSANVDNSAIVPSHWLFVAQQNNDSKRILIGNGQTVDYWRALTGSLASGFSAISGTTTRSPGGVYKDGQGIVHMELNITSNAARASTVDIGLNVPAGYYPGAVICLTGQNGTTGTSIAKLFISPTGNITLSAAAAGNYYFSSISYPAEG